MKKHFILVLLTITVFYASVVGAFALTLTVSDSTGWQSTTTNLSTWNGTIDLPQFNNVTDPNYMGYHLASISATLASELYGNFTVTRVPGGGGNNATIQTTPNFFTFQSDFTFTLPDSPYQLIAQQLYPGTLPTVLNPGQPTRNISVAQVDPLYVDTVALIDDPSLLALFTGTGTYSVPISIYSHDLLSFTGTAPTQTRLHWANAFINLDYTYEKNQDPHLPSAVIPEPSTLILLGSGLAGLVVLRKKRA